VTLAASKYEHGLTGLLFLNPSGSGKA